MEGSVWEVVVGSGIVVRSGQELSSEALTERLAAGARVKQLELTEKDRLHYKKLEGVGPNEGWVSTTLKGKQLLKLCPPKAAAVDATPVADLKGPVWEVVVGSGVVVRSGEDISSEQLADRLAVGACVQELKLTEKDRLHYWKLEGVGPSEGWVSTTLKGKPLLKICVDNPAAADAKPITSRHGLRKLPMEAVKGRKMRILLLHGVGHCSNIVKFQAASLKKLLGPKEAEWLYLDGPIPWERVPGSRNPAEVERTEMEKRLANGQPFCNWYGWTTDDDGSVLWLNVWEGCDYLLEHIRALSPVDVIVGFSQAACITTCLIGKMLNEKLDDAWRLNVFFCGGQINSLKHNIFGDGTEIGKSVLPTIKVASAGADTFFDGAEPSVAPWYSQLLVLEHQDGHAFPSTQPRAGEIYEKVAQEIRWHCGFGDP